MVGIQCNFNPTKHQIQNNKNQYNKDYEHDRKQAFNGKIYLEDFPI